MEHINDILKPLIGIALIFSFVMIFSSCEKKGGIVENTDTAIIIHKKNSSGDTADTREDTTSGWKEKMKQESAEIEESLKSLGAKAKKAGGKAESEISKSIEKLKTEGKNIRSDSSNSKLKDNWNEFKEKVKNTVDSLNKKI